MSTSPEPAAHDDLLRQAIASLQQGDVAAASAAVDRLLARGPDAAAFHLLAMVRMERGELALAGEAMREALDLAPDDPDVLTCAGTLAMREQEPAEAIAWFQRALAADATHRTALCWLGSVLQQQGSLEAAHAVFTICTEAHPDFAEGWCNLGGVCAALGRLPDAAQAYRRALTVAPEHPAGFRGLMWAFASMGDEKARSSAVRAWLAMSPGHPVATHLAMALGDAPAPPRCSKAFVAALFDDFASSYDRVLAGLDTRIASTFAAMWNEANVVAKSVLDLGCGTGSASGWLRAEGRRIVGVDLSPGMLALAAGTGLYAELHRADASDFLAATTELSDAIVLADVVPYFGALDALLAAVAAKLSAGGHVLLSFESSPRGGCVLAKTGRYQHDDEVVRAAAAAGGLAVVRIEHVALRREGGDPVAGACAMLRSQGRL